jgi:hypothetical protein
MVNSTLLLRVYGNHGQTLHKPMPPEELRSEVDKALSAPGVY